MSDIAEIYALPRLLGKLTRLAPMARIDVVPLQPDDGVAAMRSGEIDLSVGHMKDPDKECLTVDLFNDRFVCMIRAGHPLAQANLTRANFDKLRFFFARISTPTHQLVEQWLTEGASAARIAVRGHFTAAPDVIRNSDLAAVFPETMALRLPRAKDFRLFDLPFSLPPIEVKVHSHARFTGDLGIAWMRSTLAQALRKNR
ncbi:PCP degradation transcriptional activation protein [subsurface metagenome]